MLKLPPAAKNRMMMPIIRPTSPTRVVRNAFSAASEFVLLLPPVADQHERAEADQLPTHDELQRVVGHHEQQHRRGEQGEGREVVGVAPVAVHVAGGVDVHEQRDGGDDEQHHHRQAVDMDAGLELHPPGLSHVMRVLDGAAWFFTADPLRGDDHREHEGSAHGQDAESAPFRGSRLPKNRMTKNGARREERDQPGVVEHDAAA